MADAHWREMEKSDLADVSRIAMLCHPDFPEGAAVLAEKLRLSPESCFILENDRKEVIGYLIAHPWVKDSAPALDTLLKRIPADADVVYLHDIALLPEARGDGNAARGIALLSEWAVTAGFHTMALIAVNDSASFWDSQGFETVEPTPALAKKLKTYSNDAVYMLKERL